MVAFFIRQFSPGEHCLRQHPTHQIIIAADRDPTAQGQNWGEALPGPAIAQWRAPACVW